MIRRLVPWTLFPMMLALGCEQNNPGNTGVSPDAGAAPTAIGTPPAASAPAAPAHAVLGRHPGVGVGLFLATNDLALSQAQQTALAPVDVSLRTGDEAVAVATRAYRSSLQAGIKAGKLDTAKLSDTAAAVDKAVGDAKDREASALDSLHSVLDPAQRATAVATARGRQNEHDQRMAAWLAADGGAADWRTKRVEELTTELSLDATQQKQVAAVMAKTHEPPASAAVKTRWDDADKRKTALYNAFEGATFEAKKLDLGPVSDKTAHETLDHLTAFVAQLLPVLHPDQRDKLAAHFDHPLGSQEMTSPAGTPPWRHPIDEIVFPFIEPTEGTSPDASTPSPTFR
jgi:Spy/CpxP family protein refolding chaperone